AKIAAGLLEPLSGRIERCGRASYLSQDPGRYVLRERADEEVAVGVDGDLAAAGRALAAVGLGGYEERHPRDLSSGERERLALAAVGAFAAAAWAATTPRQGALSLLLLAAALLVAGAAWLDPGLGASKTLALVATLAAAAAGGRVLFAAVPGVQPVTVIAVAAGAALGARAGFGVGALAALASNFFLGQG